MMSVRVFCVYVATRKNQIEDSAKERDGQATITDRIGELNLNETNLVEKSTQK